MLGPLIALAVTTAPLDTVHLVQPRNFFWSRRPRTDLVVDHLPSGETRVHLIVTAREPQFFSNTRVELREEEEDQRPSTLTTIMSDSSWVEIRATFHAHTLWFPLTAAQLSQWAAAKAPAFRVGKLHVVLDEVGRAELSQVLSVVGTHGP